MKKGALEAMRFRCLNVSFVFLMLFTQMVRSTLLNFDLVWPMIENQALNGNLGNLALFSKNYDLNEK